MFSKKIPKLGGTLALRLTIWYAAIFAVSSVLAFAFVYVLTATFVAQRTDEDMQQDLDEFAILFQQEGIERVRKEMALDTQGTDAEKGFFRLWTRDGRQLAATELSFWPGLVRAPAQALRDIDEGGRPVFDTLELPSRNDSVRTITGIVGPGIVLEMGQSLEDDEEFVAAILHLFLLRR